jgi:hypothetical protein
MGHLGLQLMALYDHIGISLTWSGSGGIRTASGQHDTHTHTPAQKNEKANNCCKFLSSTTVVQAWAQ